MRSFLEEIDYQGLHRIQYCYPSDRSPASMPIQQPTAQVKAEIVAFIRNLLQYGVENHHSDQTQIERQWNKGNLKIKATIDQLLPLFSFETPDLEKRKKVSHLRYILIDILEKRLKIFKDERPKNRQGKHQGIREWIFILKLWYPCTEADYISLNLSAFEQHWHKTYKSASVSSLTCHNLPQPRYTKFIGHKTALDNLNLLLTQNRQQIISIEGMAGVGKTTLAVEAAYKVLERGFFSAIVFSSAQSEQFLGAHLTRRFMAERNLQDILQVISRVLNRLDLLPSQLEAQIRSIYEMLAEQPTLLIIDNIESTQNHFETINFISNLPPTVKVIITSRVRLGIGQVIALKPFPFHESKELIYHQAKTQNLDIQDDQLCQIWQSTQGLPLAITYLVGSVANGGLDFPDVIPELANSDLALFCFAQSINQLKSSPNSKAYPILLTLSLFVESASTIAIAYIAQIVDQANLLDQGLHQLHQSSLVFGVAPERYALHSLTREYVQLELKGQSQIAIDLRHRWQNWYLALLSPFKHKDWQDWHDYRDLDSEWKNIRNVMDWYITQEQYVNALEFWSCLKGYTLLGGKWQQRLNWLELLLEMAMNQEDLATHVELKFHQSVTLAFIDETDSQGHAIRLALEAWENHHYLDSSIQFDISMYIAALHIRKESCDQDSADHFQTAKTWLERGKQILEDNSNPGYQYPTFQIDYYQAELDFRLGNLEQAHRSYIQAQKLAQKAKCQRFSHYADGRIGLIMAQFGELLQAEKCLKKLLKGTEKYDDLRAGNICRFMLARVKKEQGDWKAAQEYAQQAKIKFTRLNMKREADQANQFLLALSSDSSSHKQPKSTPSIG